MNFLWYLIIGIAAGFIAAKIMKGKGLGLILNLIVGAVGSVIGGWVFSLFNFSWGGIAGNLMVATVGAIILLWFISLFKKN